MDLISIIVSIYNGEKYLPKCIDSIISQKYQNLEIILVDDGSADDSGLICDKYALYDERIKVIHTDNKGAPSARKIGYSQANGKYISIIDSDDWLEEDMLERLHSAIKEYDVDVAMCGRLEEYGEITKKRNHGIEPGVYKDEQLITDIFPRMMVNGDFFRWGIFPSFWDKLFKKEVMAPYIYNVDDCIPMGNDAAGVYPILLNVNSLVILEECYYHYRQTNQSMIRSIDGSAKQRKGFSTLYHNVNDAIIESKFNCQDQWLQYLLFLMIPRVDVLYKDLSKLPYLYPFRNVEKNSRVAIYGMGIFGQRLSNYLSETNYCKVVARTDSDYLSLNTLGYDLIDPNELRRYNFDYVLIAITYADAVAMIKQNLSESISMSKIQTIDINFASRPEHLRALGLI